MTTLETSEIQLATSHEQIQACYGVMRQLRPQFTSEELFIERIKRQISQGYHLAYLQDQGQVKALAGFRFLELLAWGKIIYIDDLVSDQESRKRGYGSKILNWVVNEAKKAQCDQVHLDSGHQRYDAHRFYLKNNFKITAHHLSLSF